MSVGGTMQARELANMRGEMTMEDPVPGGGGQEGELERSTHRDGAHVLQWLARPWHRGVGPFTAKSLHTEIETMQEVPVEVVAETVPDSQGQHKLA